MATEDLVQQLSQRLGKEWPAISAAASMSGTRMRSLDAALGRFTTEDTSIVVFGSLARKELTAGSDLDWALLVDGIADPEHLEATLDIEDRLNDEEVKGPGAEATFGGLVFSHDLINYIGGSDDTTKSNPTNAPPPRICVHRSGRCVQEGNQQCSEEIHQGGLQAGCTPGIPAMCRGFSRTTWPDIGEPSR